MVWQKAGSPLRLRYTWQVVARERVERLDADLQAARAAGPPAADEAAEQRDTELGRFQQEGKVIESAIDRARETVDMQRSPLERIADWWTGRQIEKTWRALHLAEQRLLLIQPEDIVRAGLVELSAAVEADLPHGDARIKLYQAAIDAIIGFPEKTSRGKND
jgi:hypothetical protein